MGLRGAGACLRDSREEARATMPERDEPVFLSNEREHSRTQLSEMKAERDRLLVELARLSAKSSTGAHWPSIADRCWSKSERPQTGAVSLGGRIAREQETDGPDRR